NDVPPPSHSTPELPPELDDLVLRATRRDIDSRPTDASVLLTELDQLRTRLGLADPAIPIPTPARDEDFDPEDTAPAVPVPTQSSLEPHGTAGPRGTQALPRESTHHGNDETSVGEPDSTRPDRTRPRGTLWLTLWVLTGLLLLTGLGTGVWWFTSGRWVDVPQVAGMPKEEAAQRLREAQLVPTITEERHYTTPTGTVIHTDPDAGG